MKSFELSSKEDKNGRRHFKAILYKIHPDSCVDEVNQVGTEYNKNGITFIEEYCRKALPSIEGMSIRCEFLDEDRTELHGHGETGTDESVPVFEDAVMIGTFTKGYIDEIETDEGTIKACIGEGEIDGQCYHNLVKKLDENIANGEFPSGSIEIMHTADNESIIYKYGYKEKGRIPMEFIHSGYALLGVTPADDNAKLIELNNKHKEDLNTMNEVEIKTIVSHVVDELSTHTSEINKIQSECDAKIAEMNAKVETIENEKNELVASTEQLQKALEACKQELHDAHEKEESLYDEMNELREALAKARAAERLNEMNAAIAEFTDEEKAYAEAEIEAFNANPIESEINSVVNKIWEGIGKAAKEAERKCDHETNEHEVAVEDIFSEVSDVSLENEDMNIF